MGYENSKVKAMIGTGFFERLHLEIKPLLEIQKCTIDLLSPNVPHHVLTLKLGEKDGIPVSITHSLSSKGHTPPYYSKINTGVLLPSGTKIHYNANMIIPNNYLNEVPYKVNRNYPFQEIFRNELGPMGTSFSLMGNEIKYYVPNTKLIQYEPHIINYDYKKYCNERNIEMDDDLDLIFKETIYDLGSIGIWETMNWEDRLQFQVVTIVEHYPYLKNKIWSLYLNDNFDNFDDPT